MDQSSPNFFHPTGEGL